MGSDQHSVATRSIDFFHNEIGQMGEHIFEGLLLAATPCGHIFQNWLFTGIEADDLWHIGINRLVISNSCPDSIG